MSRVGRRLGRLGRRLDRRRGLVQGRARGGRLAEPDERFVPGRGGAPVSRRAVLVVALALAGMVLLQVTLIAFLPTPGAVPDLVLVAVAALAVTRGPLVGGLAGAWAGLLLDLVPPAAGPLAGWMLVLTALGAGLGRVSETYRPGPWAAMLLVVAGAVGGVLFRFAVLWFAAAPPSAAAAVRAALASAAWALLLAPLALLLAAPRRPGPGGVAAARTVPAEIGAP